MLGIHKISLFFIFKYLRIIFFTRIYFLTAVNLFLIWDRIVIVFYLLTRYKILFKISFLKLYFIDYAITVVLIFLPLPPFPLPHPLPQEIPPPLFMSRGHACKFFGYHTLHLHGYSVTTYLYFSIPSSLTPFSHIPLPSLFF